ncbi:MAG TPA: nickel insertion protein, partial [Nitriliruptorales bacterium]
MRILHLDCSSGVAGEMWLGALIGAGASVEAVQDAVAAMGVGDVRITIGRVQRAGIQATSVRVRAPQETPSLRTWEQIRRLLEFAAIDDAVRDRSLATLERLAVAVGQAHGVGPDQVGFHEVGALDTIADIVGTQAALASLDVERVTCG